jgi:hypothetical protein
LDLQSVHIGAKNDGLCSLPAAECSNHAGAAHTSRDLKAKCTEQSGDLSSRAILLESKLGMSVNVLAKSTQDWT